MFEVGDLICLKKAYKGFIYYNISIKDLINILEVKGEANLFQYREFIEGDDINFLILEKEKYFPNKVSFKDNLLIYSVMNKGRIFSLTDIDKKATVDFCFYKVV
mgnify:CR=1 FL=1|tara:strand:- start:2738 stop:3049 length:312 start_codon:yes stop_codon:yes gene_type:complete